MAISRDAQFQNIIYFLNMRIAVQTTIMVVLLVFSNSCEKIKYYPDKEYQEVTTMILAHRAGGGEHSPYEENSLEAAQYGLSLVDGLEVDIQISKAGPFSRPAGLRRHLL